VRTLIEALPHGGYLPTPAAGLIEQPGSWLQLSLNAAFSKIDKAGQAWVMQTATPARTNKVALMRGVKQAIEPTANQR